MTSGSQIMGHLKSNPCFNGLNCKVVFMNDNIDLSNVQRPFAYIINIESEDGGVGHWVVLFHDGGLSRDLVYFDSFGAPPPEFILNNISTCELFNHCEYNSFPIQHKSSKVCGLYSLLCVYFLFCKKTDLETFVNVFSSDLCENDRGIISIYSGLF